MKKLVFFASGSGTNFQSVIDAVENGSIHASIAGLITNKDHIGALKRAKQHDIPSRVLKPANFESTGQYNERLLQIIEDWNPDLIVLAGYLQKIPKQIIDTYPNKIINIHPSLLPQYGGKGFYGLNVHRSVIENGEKETGCSVHIVTKKYDKGPVLAQKKVPVHPDDTPEKLAERVLQQEHKLLPEVIRNLTDDPHYYQEIE